MPKLPSHEVIQSCLTYSRVAYFLSDQKRVPYYKDNGTVKLDKRKPVKRNTDIVGWHFARSK